MKITCVGDSLTYGNVGYSYVAFLDKDIKALNKGRNGETLRGLYRRLIPILNSSKYDSDIYVLGIGTNDILLPYLRSVSPFWRLFMGVRCKIKKCIEDDSTFYKEYDQLLDLLFQRKKEVILFGMPFINLKDFPHGKLLKRNEIIRELAKKYSYPFIDIYTLQKERIEKDHRVYTWKGSFLLRVTDAMVMTLFSSLKDGYGYRRGLTTSVDGAHFTSASAKLLAKAIEEHLRGEKNPS